MTPPGLYLQPLAGARTLPPLCDPTVESVADLKQPGEHICTRFCQISHLFGNAYRCETTGAVHICDINCNQKIFYDNHSQICRLSRRIFSNQEILMEDIRKRTTPGELDCNLLPRKNSRSG
uniref:F-box protein skip31 n=1 Tax=Tetraselmis sp. GSL018 TaxID=582737 RepID=A0A061RXP7_9CHLO